MNKMIRFYKHKGIDMLQLGCTPPNLAKICLRSSTTAKLHPISKEDKDLPEKVRDDMVEGRTIVFTRKVVVGKTKIRS